MKLNKKQESILHYVDMAAYGISFEKQSLKSQLEKASYFCKLYKLKISKKALSDLIRLELEKKYKEQREYIFYKNIEAA